MKKYKLMHKIFPVKDWCSYVRVAKEEVKQRCKGCVFREKYFYCSISVNNKLYQMCDAHNIIYKKIKL